MNRSALPFFRRLAKAEARLLLRCLPSFLIQSFCLFALFGAVLFAAWKAQPEGSELLSIHVGVVLPEKSNSESMLIRLLRSSAENQTVLHLDQMDYSLAEKKIKNNEIIAAVVFPENFIQDALYGNELTLTLLLPRDSGFETAVFQDLIQAAVTMVIDTQNGCYAAHEVSADYGLDYALDDKGNEIALTYVKAIFSRLDLFEEETLRVTGSLTFLPYYGTSGLLLLLLLSGITFAPLFAWKNDAFADKMNIAGLSPFIEGMIPVSVMLLYYGILLGIIFGLCSILPPLRQMLPASVLIFVPAAFAVMLTCATLINLIYQAVGSLTGAALFLLFGSLILLLISGGFIPSAYLPKALVSLSRLIPTSPMLQTLRGALTETFPLLSLLQTFLWGAGFYLASSILAGFHRNQNRRNTL